jgi:hypothetical protein
MKHSKRYSRIQYTFKTNLKKGIKRTRRPYFKDSEPDLQRNSYIEVLALRIGKITHKDNVLRDTTDKNS